jgi:hypothetical protein
LEAAELKQREIVASNLKFSLAFKANGAGMAGEKRLRRTLRGASDSRKNQTALVNEILFDKLTDGESVAFEEKNSIIHYSRKS